MTDIVDTLTSNGSFTSFLQALDDTGLSDTLRESGPFTLFAPNDPAFATASLRDLLNPLNRDTLKTVLLYHIVPGAFKASQINAATSMQTLEGKPLAFEVQAGGAGGGADGPIQIDNDSRVIQADLSADNGIIHIIDGVLTP